MTWKVRLRIPATSIMLGLFVTMAGGGSTRSAAQERRNDSEIWGGEHVELRLDRSGGELTFDCATGHFEGPLQTDRRGRFAIKGSYTPEYHGPVRDDIHLDRAVTYAGTIRKNAMTLEVQPEGAAAQTYSLMRGRRGALTSCK